MRAAVAEDVPRLVELMAAHAAYERARIDTEGLAERLLGAMVHGSRASCIVAEIARCVAPDRQVPHLVGYTTFASEWSTWSGRDHVHMDTLFVEEAARGRGVGARLVEAVLAAAAAAGVTEVQWQTPSWNLDAIRFYERLGATCTSKARFRLDLSS